MALSVPMLCVQPLAPACHWKGLSLLQLICSGCMRDASTYQCAAAPLQVLKLLHTQDSQCPVCISELP